MTDHFHVASEILLLARALGLIDSDGLIAPAWFDDPLERLRTVISSPDQRAALYQLLDTLFPSEAAPQGDPAARWHPLLDRSGRGNVYFTREGDTVGVAATIETPAGVVPGARASVRLPLIDLNGPAPRAIAGTPDGPLVVALQARWSDTSHPSGMTVLISVDGTDRGALRVVLDNLDPAAPGTPTEIDPRLLDASAVRAIAELIGDFLAARPEGSPATQRVVAHLPWLLGLVPPVAPFPMADLLRNANATNTWFAALARDPATLQTWVTHLVGLFGAGPPDSAPPVHGAGTPGDPWRFGLLDLDGGSSLDVTLAIEDRDGSGSTLVVGLLLTLHGDSAEVNGHATVFSVPLERSSPTLVLPAAVLTLTTSPAEPVVDDSPRIKVGRVTAGIGWDGVALGPVLELLGVEVDGTAYPRLDLTHAEAVLNAASSVVHTALADALGSEGVGASLQALVGLVPPATDPSTPHVVSLTALAQSPTRAIADIHRRVLGDPQHGWVHLFGALVSALGISAAPLGEGTQQSPWSVALAQHGAVKLELAAWNAREAGTTGGAQLLRFGLRVSCAAEPWRSVWLAEVLAFDLAEGEPASTAFGATQHLSLALSPVMRSATGAGLTISAKAISIDLDWVPGNSPEWAAAFDGLEIVHGVQSVGPLALRLSAVSFDAAAPDLGLGLPTATAMALLRMVVAEALYSWGGPAAVVVGGLLGVHNALAGLPLDWPLIEPPDQSHLGSLLDDPVAAIRRHVMSVVANVSTDGQPFIIAALPWVRDLLAGDIQSISSDVPPATFSICGLGTYRAPWIFPIGDGTLELVCWLEPDGAPRAWQEAAVSRLRLATEGASLLTHLEEVAGLLPEVASTCAGREAAHAGEQLDRLATWLSITDGLVPEESQIAVGGEWRVGTSVLAAHADVPTAPAAIQQIRQQLATWSGGSPHAALLLAPNFANHLTWSNYLRTAEPAHPADAHFDLRAAGIDVLTLGLDTVTAVAVHYTADLANGTVEFMSAQLGRVVSHVLSLTGNSRIYLVAHSTAGLVARLFASTNADAVAGVITLATPLGGSPLTPLTDSDVAEAVRVAAAFVVASDPNPISRALLFLAAMLDGRVPYAPEGFDRVFEVAEVVPGLAIPASLGGELIGHLADTVAQRAAAAAAETRTPTHVGVGARLRLDTPDAAPNDVAVGASLRLDAIRFPLGDHAATASSGALHVQVDIDGGDGQWLVGAPASRSARLRRAEFGFDLQPAADLAAAAVPFFRLFDAGVAGTLPVINLPELLTQVPAVPKSALLTATRPESGTAAAFLVDAFEALGLVAIDGTGTVLFSLEQLAAASTHPVERFGPRLPALLDLIAGRADDDAWWLRSGNLPLELRIQQHPWRIRVRSRDSATHTDVIPLGPGVSISFQAELQTSTLATSAIARATLGGNELIWTSPPAALTLTDSSTTDPIPLSPPASTRALRTALARSIPAMVTSALASSALGTLLGGTARVRGLGRLLTSPAEWLTSPHALGRASGTGLDPAKITALLEAVSRAMGTEGSGGLTLPGGLALTAAGTNAVRLELAGTIELDPHGSEIEFHASLQVDQPVATSPAGAITLRLPLPGRWGGIAIGFAAAPSGLSLSVTPSGSPPILLLPQFSGIDALAGGATFLLPRVLQATVSSLAPQPARATGLLAAALRIAHALGLYDFDEQGFEAPGRVAEFRRMLQHGWLDSKVNSGPAIVQTLVDMFRTPSAVIQVPGSVDAHGLAVEWTYQTHGGTICATVGWAQVGTGGEAHFTTSLRNVALGAVVADEIELGYRSGVVCRLALHLHPDGALAFFRPAMDVRAADRGMRFEVYPLGAEHLNDLAIRIAPAPEAVITGDGARGLMERWVAPLAATLLLDRFSQTLAQPLWASGPSALQIMERAGLVKGEAAPPVLASPLPDTAQFALGALRAVSTGITIATTPGLDLTLLSTGGRYGIRLKGRHDIGGTPTVVSMRFGEQIRAGQNAGSRWLDDARAGVTLWLLEDASAGALTLRVSPALDVTGLGVVLSGTAGDALIGGPVHVGALGAFLFLEATFGDATSGPTVHIRRLGAALEVDDAHFNLSAEDGDAFVRHLLPAALQAPFNFAVFGRANEGLNFHPPTVGNGLELAFPVTIGASVMHATELLLRLNRAAGTVTIEAAMSGSARLGPLQVTIRNVGMLTSIGSRGTRLAFRPPDGLGLTLDTPFIDGGGFLSVDEPKGQYAGVLQLQLETLSLTAIGLLNTKMPDGSPVVDSAGRPGFSLLIFITAEFPPLQLGFGFTLQGVGGLLGLNRTINIAAFRTGLRTQALQSVLSPPDPVANAAPLITALSTLFPTAPGEFVLGPTLRVTWGTPAILTLDLGVVVRLPEPKIVVLGRMKLALPHDDDLALVLIHLDAVGALDFALGEVSIDAVMYDSRIAGFTLTGGMAFRAQWKEHPSFALAVGGFHPAFQPPPGFPHVDRIAVSLASGNNPRLRLEAYFALTSNTIQFGASVDFHVEALEFEIDGHLSFDALFQLDPFGFLVDASASLTLRFLGETICGIAVDAHLSGPSPWHIWGKAHITVLFFTVTVPIDHYIGSAATPAAVPSRPVSDLVDAAIRDPANWSAHAPTGETVITLAAGREHAVAHPFGHLTFRQRVVPFQLTLSRYGRAEITGIRYFNIEEVRIGDDPVPSEGLTDEYDAFAPAQFLALTDDEKLSRPSFEPFVCGVTVRLDMFDVDELGAEDTAPLGYELIPADDSDESGTSSRSLRLAPDAANAQTSGGAAAMTTRHLHPRRFAGRSARIRVNHRRFAVVPSVDRFASMDITLRTFAQAMEESQQRAAAGEQVVVVAAVEDLA